MLVAVGIAISLPVWAGESDSNLDTAFIKIYIQTVATLNGINADEFWLVAQGESKLNLKAVGDHGNSYGLWQIYLPKHKITKACVLDLICATAYAVKLWKQNPYQWTCMRELRGLQKTNNCGYRRYNALVRK